MEQKTTVATLLHLAEELRNLTKESVPFGLKYKIELYLKRLKELTTPVEEQRNNLITTLSGGNKVLLAEVDGAPNPQYEKYTLAWQELLNEPMELPAPILQIPLSRLSDMHTDKAYPVICEYLILNDDGTETN